MNNNETKVSIEITVAVTGQVFSAEVLASTTVGEIIDRLMEFHHLDPGLGKAWDLLCGGQILANNAVIADLIDNDSHKSFDLIAKVQGG